MKWMGPAAAFVALQLAFCAALALAIGFYQPPPFLKYAATAASFVGLIAGCRALWNLRHRPDQPTRHLLSLDWSQHRGFALAMILVWLQFVALTWGKAMLPSAGTFWADVPLADAEAALLGTDAWKLLPAPHWLLDAIYMAWLPTIGGIFAWLYFSGRSNRETGLLAFFLTIGILGTVGQYLLPSGGPIFFERLGLGERFADMPYSWQTHRAADMLWSAFHGQYINFATGISAFPSIHVATCAWAAITFRHWVAFAYLALIFLGSIILGWHYALDGVAGGAGAAACYLLAKQILARRPRISLAAAQ
jgi:hypothetical protein